MDSSQPPQGSTCAISTAQVSAEGAAAAAVEAENARLEARDAQLATEVRFCFSRAGWSGAKVRQSCRSRNMLHHAYLLVTIGLYSRERTLQSLLQGSHTSALHSWIPNSLPSWHG